MATEGPERVTRGPFTPRVILTMLGGIAIIVGAFLAWNELGGNTATGTDLGVQALFTDDQLDLVPGIQLTRNDAGGFDEYDQAFLTSAGLVVIIIGAAALAGLATSRRWLTRIAGALAIAVFVLFDISMFRAEADYFYFEGGVIGSLRIGIWLVLLGGIVALVGSPRVATARSDPAG